MTRKMLLIAGVAGLALTAPVSAEKGGRGGERPQQAEPAKGGGEKAQRPERQQQSQAPRAERQVQRMERPQRAERQIQRMERPQRAERQVQRMERPQRAERQVQRMERPQRIERQAQRAERPQRDIRRSIERSAKVDRQQRQVERKAQRVERQAQRVERVKTDRRDVLRLAPQGERRFAERRTDERRPLKAARFDGRGFRPLAPVFSGRQMRPMQTFKTKFDDRQYVSIGDRVGSNITLASVPTFYASRYVDTPDYYYRYNSDLGYVYRIERDDGIVRSMIPLFGGYGIGDPWPATYYSSYVPLGYRDYYYDTPDYYYRNDGYGIYQVDSSTQLITALVALLGGQSLGVGQMLPASFGAYNVPLDYRDSYYDTDDRWYRYDDGYIYQVDPGNRRIAASYPIYGDDYLVGDPWPVAYPDYNVPYGYQSLYADTPQYQYRYANGGIYQVDPTNQVILALAALVSGNQFAVGQPMPGGYGVYNVPMAFRDRYYDTDDQYYRYADSYIYRVDPRSGMIEEAIPVYA